MVVVWALNPHCYHKLPNCLLNMRSPIYSRPPQTMCPTAFLSPTLQRLVSSALSHTMRFFWPNLRCKVIQPMAKSRCLVKFPAKKKRFQNLGPFKKNSSIHWPKKNPKIGPGPALAWTWSAETGSASGKHLREMPNLRLKVRTQRRPAQFSCSDRLPERRSNRTYCGGPLL